MDDTTCKGSASRVKNQTCLNFSEQQKAFMEKT